MLALARLDRQPAAPGRERDRDVLAQNANPTLLILLLDRAGERLGEDALQHQPTREHHRHMRAVHAQRRRDLRTDKAPAHDEYRLPFRVAAQLDVVVERAVVEDVFELSARDLQAARRSAGGEEQLSVALAAAPVGEDRLLAGSDLADPFITRQLDAGALEVSAVVNEDVGYLVLARPELLAERRAVIGEMRLGADEQNRA